MLTMPFSVKLYTYNKGETKKLQTQFSFVRSARSTLKQAEFMANISTEEKNGILFLDHSEKVGSISFCYFLFASRRKNTIFLVSR